MIRFLKVLQKFAINFGEYQMSDVFLVNFSGTDGFAIIIMVLDILF